MRTCIFVLAAATLLVISVSAQSFLAPWPYLVEITAENNSAGIHDIVLPLNVMDKARADLADLRLYDGANREVPYAIRIRKDVDERQDISGRRFNYVTSGPSSSEVSVDLGENHGEHNEVEVETDGTNFRRQVQVEGSDNGRDWRTLTTDGVVFSFASQDDVVESERVDYSTSRYRYLRIRVMRDQLVDDKVPQITDIQVRMAVRDKGQLSTWAVPVPSYQLLRNQGAHATAWTIDLGARTPCDRLSLQIQDNSFSRPFQVEVVDDPENIRVIATGDLTRHAGDSADKPLMIYFNQEERVRTIRLQITDYSNPTLDVTSIEASAPARQLVFEVKEPAVQSLRLFFGAPNVAAPHYDFEKEIAARLSSEPIHSKIGYVQSNLEYKPEPLPFTERVPWLVYLVLAASSIALALTLLNLARTAMRRDPQPVD